MAARNLGVVVALSLWACCSALRAPLPVLARRDALWCCSALVGAALLPPLVTPSACKASDAPPAKFARLRFSSPGEEGELGVVTVELTRGANEQAVALFGSLVAGTLSAPCDRAFGQDAILERERLEKSKALRTCLASEAQPLSYEGSTVWRVVPGMQINAGALTSSFNLRLPAAIVGDNNGGLLQHDAAGEY